MPFCTARFVDYSICFCHEIYFPLRIVIDSLVGIITWTSICIFSEFVSSDLLEILLQYAKIFTNATCVRLFIWGVNKETHTFRCYLPLLLLYNNPSFLTISMQLCLLTYSEITVFTYAYLCSVQSYFFTHSYISFHIVTFFYLATFIFYTVTHLYTQ